MGRVQTTYDARSICFVRFCSRYGLLFIFHDNSRMTLKACILYYAELLYWNSFHDVALALSRKVICLHAKNCIFILSIWSFMEDR